MPANQLLSDIDCGGATAELIPLVYYELRRLAAHYLRREGSGTGSGRFFAGCKLASVVSNK